MTVGHLDPSLAPIRPSEFWPLVVAQLRSTTMDQILGVAKPEDDDRIYGPGEDLPDEEPGTKRGAAWGRLVVLSVSRLWELPGTGSGITEQPKRERLLPFLVRAEFNSPSGGYNPGLALDAAQAEVFARLEGWEDTTGMTYAEHWIAVHRTRPPQAGPMYDEKRGLWWSSSQWQVVLAPPGA